MQKPIRVLVVDDSALMRIMVSRLLEETGKFKIIATASNGEEGVQKICALKPDAVTMDVEMPKMDGLSALKEVMRRCPLPVIMLSTLTTAGARATMEALAAGAVDFVPKPASPAQVKSVTGQLAEKLSTAVHATIHATPARKVQPKKPPAQKTPEKPLPPPRSRTRVTSTKANLVVIGSSTGGPAALQSLLPTLPQNFPAAIVVVQHIPAGFSQPMADHLARKCNIKVRHAQHNDPVIPGHILVAPAGYDLDFKASGSHVTVKLDQGLDRPLKPGQFRPSVDWVMSSAASVYGKRAMGVLLTGMGKDGAQGLAILRESGSYTIAEDESTCVVYGMPKAAAELGAAVTVLPLTQIAREILRKV
ncbi:MAG: chemotaxis response regulator protein-glutamate methylesterase [Firmicutes bacterium]|nr:chemotaxis response regulator protein-glutamate methylesterase [Bacillota bacterium]